MGMEGHANMGVMQIIRRTNANHLNSFGFWAALLFIQKTLKTLWLGEKMCLWKIGVYNANRIMRIERSDEVVASIPNCFQVARGDIACCPSQCKICHQSVGLYFR